jgi:hypothetical protein
MFAALDAGFSVMAQTRNAGKETEFGRSSQDFAPMMLQIPSHRNFCDSPETLPSSYTIGRSQGVSSGHGASRSSAEYRKAPEWRVCKAGVGQIMPMWRKCTVAKVLRSNHFNALDCGPISAKASRGFTPQIDRTP